MQRYRYCGIDPQFVGCTAIGQIRDGEFVIQVDVVYHPWAQGWHPANPDHWRVDDSKHPPTERWARTLQVDPVRVQLIFNPAAEPVYQWVLTLVGEYAYFSGFVRTRGEIRELARLLRVTLVEEEC